MISLFFILTVILQEEAHIILKNSHQKEIIFIFSRKTLLSLESLIFEGLQNSDFFFT